MTLPLVARAENLNHEILSTLVRFDELALPCVPVIVPSYVVLHLALHSTYHLPFNYMRRAQWDYCICSGGRCAFSLYHCQLDPSTFTGHSKLHIRIATSGRVRAIFHRDSRQLASTHVWGAGYIDGDLCRASG